MRNNQLSSLLVAPDELIKYLKDINSQLKTGSTLPLVVTEHTIHEYYSLNRVSAWLVDNHVLRFFLNIPLKNNDRLYNLYKVLPVPTGTPGAEKNHLYTYVQPHTDYIAVSTDEQRYIPMTRCQVNDCKGKTVKMCVGPNVVNNLASGQDTCESVYFRQITPPKELCDTRLSYVATSIWTEIPGTDRWIFVLPREEVMTFTCPGTDGLPEHEGTEYVQGTGLLTLSTKCEMFGSSFRIYSKIIYKALRGTAVVISLRRLHSEERSRCWDQSPQTAQRGTGRGSRQNS
ncbi:hypothetical protein J6590_037685 [Homalodisca vitripennis]|nr:hypothetical protein J6590_037685 [Homalodisca vitripennis]